MMRSVLDFLSGSFDGERLPDVERATASCGFRVHHLLRATAWPLFVTGRRDYAKARQSQVSEQKCTMAEDGWSKDLITRCHSLAVAGNTDVSVVTMTSFI